MEVGVHRDLSPRRRGFSLGDIVGEVLVHSTGLVLLGNGFSPWNPVYILTMQVAMVVGFWFAYPANSRLTRTGVKTAL